MHTYAFRWFAALLVAAGSIAPLANAQAQAPALRPTPSSCGTDEAMRELLGPGYESWAREYAEQLRAMERPALPAGTAQRTPSGPRYIIPVVVHIIHTDGADNIADAQVYDAIRILNRVYQGQDPDTAGVIPYFKPRVGHANLEFRLAKLDPSGNCTNGITRHYSALTNIARDNVKGLPGARWDQTRYLNIWVVEFIPSSTGSAPGGTAAFAILPCNGGTRDGIVTRNDYFGSIGRSSGFYNSRTLPHEVGHHLGLPHTWGGTNTPGLASNCSTDDGIADTPNTIGYQSGCDVNSPSCPGSPDPISNVQNIMDYAGCPLMFTRGQTDVMNRGVGPSGFSCRRVLTSAANLTFTGVADGQVVPACAPTAYLRATGAAPDGIVRICPGGTVAFEGQAYNLREGAPAPTFTWSFPGGQPATATGPTASTTYATPGTYSVSLTVADANGNNNTSTRTSYVMVGSQTAGLAAPFTFDFPAAVFPTDPADSFRNWQITNYGAQSATTWEPTSVAGSPVDNESVRIRLRNATSPSTHYLYSPNIIVSSSLSRAYLSFRRAYAPATAAAADILKIDYSLDCGRTWTNRGSRASAQLRTANAVAGIFVPTATQWAADSIQLPVTLAAGTNLQVRFSVAVDGGNALYLDALRIRGRVLGTAADQATGAEVSLAPNPLTDETRVALTLTRPTRVALRVTDILGRVVLTQAEQSLPAGAHLLPIAEGLRRATAGVYAVTVLLDGAAVSRQLLVR